jgi:NAD(P)H dehydrogenase (quinone)
VKISWVDYLIFQFPLWWTEPPAILKGWFDRVFAKEFAYDNGATYEKGLLKGKKALLSFTTAGGPDIYGSGKLKGEMHE